MKTSIVAALVFLCLPDAMGQAPDDAIHHGVVTNKWIGEAALGEFYLVVNEDNKIETYIASQQDYDAVSVGGTIYFKLYSDGMGLYLVPRSKDSHP